MSRLCLEPEKSDKETIEDDGFWVPCRICLSVFRRLRFTKRYCRQCGKGGCEGEHLTFYKQGGAVCIQCNKTVV